MEAFIYNGAIRSSVLFENSFRAHRHGNITPLGPSPDVVNDTDLIIILSDEDDPILIAPF